MGVKFTENGMIAVPTIVHSLALTLPVTKLHEEGVQTQRWNYRR